MMMIPSTKHSSAIEKARDAGSHLVSQISHASKWAPLALVMRSEFLRNRVLHSRILRRKARNMLLTRVGWTVLPVAGLALAYWGIRSYRRHASEDRDDELNAGSRSELPRGERKPPKDRVDESSWESFPASDPPAFS